MYSHKMFNGHLVDRFPKYFVHFRWVLKCHACNKVTSEIGRLFCPKCGNGGTLRKVSVTVGENGLVMASRRPRVNLRGTKVRQLVVHIFSHDFCLFFIMPLIMFSVDIILS